MDIRIKDIRAMIADYDMLHIRVRDRCSAFTIKERQLRDDYVAGIRPESVRQQLSALMAWQEVTLKQVIVLTGEKLEQQHEYFKLSKLAGADEEPPKPVATPSTGVPSVTPLLSAAVPAVKQQRENHGVCRNCKGSYPSCTATPAAGPA